MYASNCGAAQSSQQQETAPQFSTFQGGSMVNVGQKQLASAQSANIHAPRNSFTKRSFGRDLSNLQNGVLLDGQK